MQKKATYLFCLFLGRCNCREMITPGWTGGGGQTCTDPPSDLKSIARRPEVSAQPAPGEEMKCCRAAAGAFALSNTLIFFSGAQLPAFNYASILCPDFPGPAAAAPSQRAGGWPHFPAPEAQESGDPPIHRASGRVSGREREARSQRDPQQHGPSSRPRLHLLAPALPPRAGACQGAYGSPPARGAFGEF